MKRPEIKSTKYPKSHSTLYYVKCKGEFVAIPENIIKYIEYLESKTLEQKNKIQFLLNASIQKK